jgi:hypothetical protein
MTKLIKKNMTLHEAIEMVLKEKEEPLTPSEIASILNDIKIYQKGDKSRIKSNQISARVNNYPSYFYKDNGLVYLNNWDNSKEKTIIQSKSQLSGFGTQILTLSK